MDFESINSDFIRLDVKLLTDKNDYPLTEEELILIDALHDKIQEARKLIHIHLGLPTE